ncbi:MAG: FliI/YscN family ATPase [Pseudomonadota bacterium]
MSLLEGFGTLKRQVGLLLVAEGVRAGLGDWCWAVPGTAAAADRPPRIPLEVVGFDKGETLLLPLGSHVGFHPDMLITDGSPPPVPEPASTYGRVINGYGTAFDGDDALSQQPSRSPPVPINPLSRAPIETVFDTGVRAINGLLTVGVGQRIGLFAGSGVGKSVLLGMLARCPGADVVVCALIGERGREVQEFVTEHLAEQQARVIVVAAPASDAPGLRLRAAELAHDLAEQERAAGKRVLLLVDSLSRVAQAQREVGLASGEPPTSKGYPPSVFTLLPNLLERGGALRDGGSITAFYTVLMEEDDPDDPIVDAARAVLDGHIVLSRKVAEDGLYPAIDLGVSLSRLAHRLQDPDWRAAAATFRRRWVRYQEQADLVLVGAYQAGVDQELDRAIASQDLLRAFIEQVPEARVDAAEARAALRGAVADTRTPHALQQTA